MTNDAQERRMDAGSMLGAFAYLALGPIIWALHLTAIYASQLLCATLASTGAHTISAIVVAATVVGLALLASALWRASAVARVLRVAFRSNRERQFLDSLMRLLAILAMAAIAWAGIAAAVLSPCAQLR